MKELEMARPTQKEMESNIMVGKSGLVSNNQNSRPDTLKKSTTGSGVGNDKTGKKKGINIAKKLGKYLKETGQIK